MSITALPTPPTRSDPASFDERGDALMAALPVFVSESNALQADVNAKQLATAESATSAANSETAAANSEAAAAGSASSAALAAQTAQLALASPLGTGGVPLSTLALIYAAL